MTAPNETRPTKTTLLDWFVTPIHIFLFVCILIGFHIPAVLARYISVRALDKVIHWHCFAHLINIRLTGTSISVENQSQIPADRPILIVSNHQAMYDIPLIMWNLRQRFPKFIAKRELQRFIPTISFALRNSDHLIIDRGRKKEALACLRRYGEKHAQSQQVICIFPEGTRSPQGPMRAFKPAGFEMLFRSLPDALILPVVVDGTGAVVAKKILPIHAGKKVNLWIGTPLERSGRTGKEVLAECETIIREKLAQIRSAA